MKSKQFAKLWSVLITRDAIPPEQFMNTPRHTFKRIAGNAFATQAISFASVLNQVSLNLVEILCV